MGPLKKSGVLWKFSNVEWLKELYNASCAKHHNWSVMICCWTHWPLTWNFAHESEWSHRTTFPTQSWTWLTTTPPVRFNLICSCFCKLNFSPPPQTAYCYFLFTFIWSGLMTRWSETSKKKVNIVSVFCFGIYCVKFNVFLEKASSSGHFGIF